MCNKKRPLWKKNNGFWFFLCRFIKQVLVLALTWINFLVILPWHDIQFLQIQLRYHQRQENSRKAVFNVRLCYIYFIFTVVFRIKATKISPKLWKTPKETTGWINMTQTAIPAFLFQHLFWTPLLVLLCCSNISVFNTDLWLQLLAVTAYSCGITDDLL